MTALEIAGLVALVTMATTILFLLRRADSTRAETGLVELWRVAFDSSPIAMLIKHNGVYVHCNDACVHILAPGTKVMCWKSDLANARLTGSRTVG